MSKTKEMILKSAIDLFAEKGYSNVSMREIASAVGIQAGSIYNHYESKSDILTAILGLLRTRAFSTLLVLQQESTYDYARTHTFDELLGLLYEPIPKADAEWVRKVLRILTVEQFTLPEAHDFWDSLVGPRATASMKRLIDAQVAARQLPCVNTLVVSELLTRVGLSYVMQFIRGDEEENSDSSLTMDALIKAVADIIKQGPVLSKPA